MDLDNIDSLLEALCRENLTNETQLTTRFQDGHFNWLDAAPATVLMEVTDKIILSCAQRMAIRSAGRLESAFRINGYSGRNSVRSNIIPSAIKAEFDRNTAFYNKTKTRLATIEHLDSINSRSNVIAFPAGTVAHHEPVLGKTDGGAEKNREHMDVYEAFETYRRTNIAHGYHIVTHFGDDSNICEYNCLDAPTMEELEESADAIVLATSSRMAIRSSLRLEVAWRDHVTPKIEVSARPVLTLLPFMDERDGYVDSYLKIREEQARIAHKQGIVERANDRKLSKPRRPHLKLKKVASA